jgi:hypothetical protein
MQLPHPFVRLPLKFDANRLAREVGQVEESEWRAHPQRFEGNSSLILVSTDGEENDDFRGPMKPVARLDKMPYVRQVMASFNTVIGRSRFMRLDPGAEVHYHTDSHYFWRNHLRIHIPVLTTPDVSFYCDDDKVHMAAGESWTFDNWRGHRVENHSGHTRIHLVIDTVGSSELWRMIDGRDSEHRSIDYDPNNDPALRFENFRGLPVLPPAELRADLTALVSDVADNDAAHVTPKRQLGDWTTDFLNDWQSLWMVHGTTAEGFPAFRALRDAYRESVHRLPDELLQISNSRPVRESIDYTLDAALVPENLDVPDANAGTAPSRPRFDRPVFIVAAPRSGSTLLFETLAVNLELWSVGDEAHKHFESVPSLRPGKDNPSNRLTAEHATRSVVDTVLDQLAADLVNADGKLFRDLPPASRLTEVRFLEKTPKNALRIPFILKAFPDARFIFLFRDARQNVSSLMDSWSTQRYVTYPGLPGWNNPLQWSHLLVPGWQDLAAKSLAEITAQQWLTTNQTILSDLTAIPPERWCAIDYDDLIANPLEELRRLCGFAQLIFGPRMVEVASRPLRLSKYTLTPPDPNKWKKNAEALAPVIGRADEFMQELRALTRQ